MTLQTTTNLCSVTHFSVMLVLFRYIQSTCESRCAKSTLRKKKIKRVIETEYLPSLSWKYLQGLQIARALAKNGHVQCPMYIQWLVNVQTPSIPTQIHQFETGPSFPHTHSHAHTDTDTDTEAHTYTCKHTHANTHTHTHIHTHTRTHQEQNLRATALDIRHTPSVP